MLKLMATLLWVAALGVLLIPAITEAKLAANRSETLVRDL